MLVGKVMRTVVADTLAITVGAVMVPLAVTGCVTELAVDGTKFVAKKAIEKVDEMSLEEGWTRA